MNVQAYKEQLEQPWGKLYYDIVFELLGNIENKKILDFGSGFGKISSFLAEKNQVTAIEPNKELLAERCTDFPYQQLQGSIERLQELADQSFDLIICHNVLEYVSEPSIFLKEFNRLLVEDGLVSIVKHNAVGRVMQTVVFENNPAKAQDFLNGKTYQTHSMGQATIYELSELLEANQLQIQSYQGIRIFYGLQPNSMKTAADWREKMLAMELAVYDQSPYRDIAQFQHVWLKKQKRTPK